jgi:ribosomal protein S18 acetylase RimI-like enzyme
MSFRRLLLSGAIVSAWRVGQEARRRMQILSQYIDKKRRELAPYNHWYLVLLGVDPKFQGRGYASRLIRGMLTRIDEEGLPCYLETDGERNVRIYRHFGFEVIDEFIIPETNVRQCAMLRQNADI